MRRIAIIILCFLTFNSFAQKKLGYTWIMGFNVDYAKFDGTLSAPLTGQKYNASHPSTPMMFSGAHSNICDSITGEILLSTGGMKLYDSLGLLVENGDSLQPNNAYSFNSIPDLGNTQGSLILPKGENKEYYLFIPTVSDSSFNVFWTNPSSNKAPFDLFRYNVVDMKLNSGSGKVIQKNRILLKDVELSKVGMQACRHSNGTDWWILKNALNDNTIYRFLVTKDSIYGPFIQNFSPSFWGWYDRYGQSAFNKQGTQYGAVMGKNSKLFLADFDRCTGELKNPKTYNIPIDSTTIPYWDNQNSFDSISCGISFSNNGNFVYIAKAFNIYQFEINQSDSSLAWYRVKHGADTSNFAFENYSHLYRAPNQRIYIGKWGGSYTQMSVIDNPDVKGSGCSFCRKCLRMDTIAGGLTSPPNLPDFELGPSNILCWPLQINKFNEVDYTVYPNPTDRSIFIDGGNVEVNMNDVKIYSIVGQELFTTIEESSSKKLKLDLNSLPKGVYILRVKSKSFKIEKD